mmetsp:Transcript_94937/g.193067  ORF Transcript_94937/g.193067 Transcript_94937/m.193067 type:complete len:89 (-) Transcript_94937:240-506(-)
MISSSKLGHELVVPFQIVVVFATNRITAIPSTDAHGYDCVSHCQDTQGGAWSQCGEIFEEAKRQDWEYAEHCDTDLATRMNINPWEDI